MILTHLTAPITRMLVWFAFLVSYGCNAPFALLHIKLFNLFTDSDPTVLIERNPNTDQLFSGDNLTLSCFITVNDNSTIFDRALIAARWLKNGIECSIELDQHISVSPMELSSDGIFITTLTFMPLKSGDSGDYQCMASLTGFTGTNFANATNSTTLVVKGIVQ